MSLSKNLLQGSFRGMPFYLKEGKTKASNFTSKHDFLNTEANYVENNGPDSKEFSISVWVQGDSGEGYARARDNFIEVLDEKGSGELIHPFLGVMQVVVSGYTFTDGLGITEFEVDLIEVKPAAKPVVDFQFDFQFKAEKTLLTLVEAMKQESALNLSKVLQQGYRFTESPIFPALKGISMLKSSLDFSVYEEKVKSLAEFATDKENWTNLYEFFIDYLDLEGHTKPFIAFYQRLLSFEREYVTASDPVSVINKKLGINLTNEILKMAAVAKLAEQALEGYLTNDEIDLVINRIKMSIHDPIIEGVKNEMEKTANLFYSLKKKVKRVIKVAETAPALVVGWIEGVGVEIFNTYNINELTEVYDVRD